MVALLLRRRLAGLEVLRAGAARLDPRRLVYRLDVLEELPDAPTVAADRRTDSHAVVAVLDILVILLTRRCPCRSPLGCRRKRSLPVAVGTWRGGLGRAYLLPALWLTGASRARPNVAYHERQEQATGPAMGWRQEKCAIGT